ncbi:MAG: sensor histidine kinase N-terminal domain-containing protein, partial [Azonexus sp.]
MNSIRRKLVLLLTATMSIVMLLGAWATYSAAKEEANTIFDYHLEQIALALRNQSFNGATEDLVGEKSFEFVVRVWDRNGLTIYSSRPYRILPDVVRLGFATEQTSTGAWRVYALQYQGEIIAVAQPTSVRARLAATAALRTLTP